METNQQVPLEPRAWLSFSMLILEVNVKWHCSQQLTWIAYYSVRSVCSPGDRLEYPVPASSFGEPLFRRGRTLGILVR